MEEDNAEDERQKGNAAEHVRSEEAGPAHGSLTADKNGQARGFCAPICGHKLKVQARKSSDDGVVQRVDSLRDMSLASLTRHDRVARALHADQGSTYRHIRGRGSAWRMAGIPRYATLVFNPTLSITERILQRIIWTVV
jgi:hypothetical protein